MNPISKSFIAAIAISAAASIFLLELFARAISPDAAPVAKDHRPRPLLPKHGQSRAQNRDLSNPRLADLASEDRRISAQSATGPRSSR